MFKFGLFQKPIPDSQWVTTLAQLPTRLNPILDKLDKHFSDAIAGQEVEFISFIDETINSFESSLHLMRDTPKPTSIRAIEVRNNLETSLNTTTKAMSKLMSKAYVYQGRKGHFTNDDQFKLKMAIYDYYDSVGFFRISPHPLTSSLTFIKENGN